MPPSASTWRDRFAAFAVAKRSAALNARTAPYVTVRASPSPALRPIGTPWSTSAFGGPFYVRDLTATKIQTCSLVFVQSADGNTVAEDPSSLGGGATDYHVVYEGLSRVAADAVLAGARTVRGGNSIFSVWHPELVDLREKLGLPRHPTQIVATRRGVDLDRELLFNVPEVPVMLLTEPARAIDMAGSLADRPWIRTIVMRNRSGLARAFSDLEHDGIRRISCVGGRSLAADLLSQRLVDDLYLTTSARRGGTPATPLPADALAGHVVCEKRGTGEDVGVIFQHFDLQDHS